MPRMSPELLLSSHSYLNPLSDRELDLRGYQIPAIENLGVTKDSLDTIDLTDNSIRSLINFPKMSRLKHLYLANNPISFISPKLPEAIPNLNSLVMSHCKLTHLNQLVAILKAFNRLEFLVLAHNPVANLKLYRDWCIFNCPKLRVLDFKRVKDQERKTAQELFYDPITKGPTGLATALSIVESGEGGGDPTTTTSGAAEEEEDSTMGLGSKKPNKIEPGHAGRSLTAEERERIKRAIEEATSVEEVRRLKRMLEQGFIPRDERRNLPASAAASTTPTLIEP